MSCTCGVGQSCTYKVPIFQAFNCEETKALLKVIKRKTYQKGELVFCEGEPADTLYIVNEGKLKIFNYTKDGKEQILHLLGEGDFWGELQLFQDTTFNCYAKAIEDCRFCLITKQHFQQLMLKKPEMSLKVLEVLSQRLIHLEQLTLMLSNQDPESKLAYLLLELAKKEGVQVGSKMVIHLPFTREEVASYTGLTRETVSRKLHQLSEKGIINIIGHRKIEILDVAYLKDLL